MVLALVSIMYRAINPLANLAKMAIVLYCPFLNSLKTGVITGTFKALESTALKYSLLAKFKNNSPSSNSSFKA